MIIINWKQYVYNLYFYDKEMLINQIYFYLWEYSVVIAQIYNFFWQLKSLIKKEFLKSIEEFPTASGIINEHDYILKI